HYNVNASIPKTLIQYLIRWIAISKQFDDDANAALNAILETRISPELVPGSTTTDRAPSQLTEATIGPFELQDFNLYYISRFGFRPSKVAFLAHHAWGSRRRGDWPADLPEEQRREYSLREIKQWLEVFVRRFFALSQFKRSCLPNGPKVGSGGSLSPRSDWRAPTDAEADVWLRELRDKIPESD